jgi:hypothetical protein
MHCGYGRALSVGALAAVVHRRMYVTDAPRLRINSK